MNQSRTSPARKDAPSRKAANIQKEGESEAVEKSPGHLPAGAIESSTNAGWRDHKVPIFVVLGVLILDQATKLWAIRALRGIEPSTGTPRKIVIIPGCFDFSYAENTGAAFSLFSDHPGLLTLVSLGIAGVIFWWYWHTPREHRGTRMALALVLGGAVGNLIDRFFRGSVVDFVHVFWRQYHWPTFNVADSAICVGIGLLILWSFREQKTP